MSEKRGFTRHEAAIYLGVSERQISKLRAEGFLPVRYQGTKPLYDRHDLDRYFDSLPGETSAS